MTDARLSKLQLDRYVTGELTDEEAADVRARLDDKAREHLVALEEARTKVPAFDIVALRSRAARLPDTPPVAQPLPPQPQERPVSAVAPSAPPVAANDRRWGAPLAILAVAAAILLAVLSQQPWTTGAIPDHQIRTGDALTLHQATDGLLQHEPYRTGTPLAPGDVLGFRVNATDRDGVVLLSIDGSGRSSVFYPASGDTPLPLSGEGFMPIGGTVRLDDTAGREVFVARFDTTVSQAIAEVEQIFAEGSYDGLVRWANDTPGADAVEITRVTP